MLKFTGQVTKDLSKIRALRRKVNPRSPAMARWKKRSAQKYRSFLYKRFDRFSRGGGNWRTNQRTRGKRRPKKFILRMSHTLFRSLSPVFRGLPGQFERITTDSIEVGIKGGRHPNASISVGRLAEIHHTGEGIQSERKIIVRPDTKLRQTLVNDLSRILK